MRLSRCERIQSSIRPMRFSRGRVRPGRSGALRALCGAACALLAAGASGAQERPLRERPRRASRAPTTTRCAARSSATCTSTPRYSLDASTQGTRNAPARRLPLRARRAARPPALRRRRHAAAHACASRARSTSPPSPTTPSCSASVTICETPGLPGYDSLVCRHLPRAGRALAFFLMNGQRVARRRTRRASASAARDGAACREAARTPWARDPGGGRGRLRPHRRLPLHHLRRLRVDRRARAAKNLHRNVIFRNAAVPDAADELRRGADAPRRSGARCARDCRGAAPAATCSPSRTTRT